MTSRPAVTMSPRIEHSRRRSRTLGGPEHDAGAAMDQQSTRRASQKSVLIGTSSSDECWSRGNRFALLTLSTRTTKPIRLPHRRAAWVPAYLAQPTPGPYLGSARAVGLGRDPTVSDVRLEGPAIAGVTHAGTDRDPMGSPVGPPWNPIRELVRSLELAQ
jgi:hypothetical protein